MAWCFSISLPQSNIPYFLPFFETLEGTVVYGEEPNTQQWFLKTYLESEPDVKDLSLKLELVALSSACPPPPILCNVVPEINWVEENYRQFPPLQVGAFYIYRSHHTDAPPETLIPLQIDGATAFGSGEHATTQGCLMALQQLAKTHHFKRPLDLGRGSGILAMAIAKLWHVKVLAADNDPEAVRVTTLNSEINDLKASVHPLLSEGFNNPHIKDFSPFDLIVANILADPLVALAPQIAEHTSAHGIVILSGFLTAQTDALLKAYLSAGFREQARNIKQDWVILILQKA